MENILTSEMDASGGIIDPKSALYRMGDQMDRASATFPRNGRYELSSREHLAVAI